MEKKKRKNRKRRLLILLMALFFTTVMFTTTTYAWFTANKTVTVSTLTVNVEATNGIQISADGINWKSILQTSDITGVASTTYTSAVNQIPDTLTPVSTIGTIDSNGHMEMFRGTVGTIASGANAGDFNLTAVKDTDTAGSTGDYIVFDMFLKVTSASDLWLTTNSGVNTIDATDTGIKNASRIAFVILGNTAAGSSTSTIQGLSGSGATTTKYIWEPNYDVHTAAAIAEAANTYGETTTATGATQLPYSGIKAEIAAANAVPLKVTSATQYSTRDSSYFATVTPTYSTVEGFSQNLQIFSLAAGITKVRVYMWVEGQDVDCENAASGGNITYDLQFTTQGPNP